MVPTMSKFKFKQYKTSDNKKDNFLLNASVRANLQAQFDPKNKRRYARPDLSIIKDIRSLPKDTKTGLPIMKDGNAE
jgi:hypothetical protein